MEQEATERLLDTNISTTQGIWSLSGSTSGYAVECLIESGYLFFRMP